MKAVAGGDVVEIPDREPGEGEVLIEVAASAVNPADYKVENEFAGRFLHARTSPLVLGYDFSGKITALGEGVSHFAEGDDVFGHLPYASSNDQGAFAEQLVAPANSIATKPESVSHITAAASATPGLTALQSLRDLGRIGAQSRVMIIGASGGVGSLAVGIGKRLGAEVCGVGSTKAVAFIEELGADSVVDRKKTDPLEHKGGFNAVFDTPAAHSFGKCSHLLTDDGVYITTLPSPGLVIGKLQSLFSGKRCEFIVVKSVRKDLEQLAEWLADGLTVEIAETYPVRDAAKAIQDVAKGGRIGRLAVDVATGF